LIGEFPENGDLYFMKDRIAGLNPFSRVPIYDAIQDIKIWKSTFANVTGRLAKRQHPARKMQCDNPSG